jgi:hypothetical protein
MLKSHEGQASRPAAGGVAGALTKVPISRLPHLANRFLIALCRGGGSGRRKPLDLSRSRASKKWSCECYEQNQRFTALSPPRAAKLSEYPPASGFAQFDANHSLLN